MKFIKKLLCSIGIHNWVSDYANVTRKCRRCKKKQHKTQSWGWLTDAELDKKINKEKENKKFIDDSN